MEIRKYVGARYVPVFADPLEWDADLKYEPLTIVTDENGIFYVSKQYVPEGITVDTTEYWIPWADWGDEISALDTRIDALEDALPIASFDDVNTVDARFDAIEDVLPLSSFDDVNTVNAALGAKASVIVANGLQSSDMTTNTGGLAATYPADIRFLFENGGRILVRFTNTGIEVWTRPDSQTAYTTHKCVYDS